MPVYQVGSPEAWTGGGVFFRLEGECEGLWHILARPYDARAKQFLEQSYGNLIVEVAGRPDWLFPNESTRGRTNYRIRFLGGPLDTAMECSFRPCQVGDQFRLSVGTNRGLVVLTYQKTEGDFAEFVSEEPFDRY